jgi:arylsulfatase A-like enzyme
LQEAGYTTGLVGKYLNSCCSNPPPQFDFWASWAGDGGSYLDPTLNVNGVVTPRTGYVTHILREYALQFLDTEAAASGPFLLLFNPTAPHVPSIPAPEDQGRYAALPPHRPPNFNEADISDKPAWLPQKPISASKIQIIDQQRQDMLATLWSVDQAIGAILDRLEARGQLDGTLVVFLSDNGWLWGEHRIFNRKNLLYEETVRVPFLVRYPPLGPVPRVESRLVANIDIAPTLYELAGLPIPPEVDGRSLVPLLQGGFPVRDALLLEAWNSATSPPWQGIRTETHVYIERDGDRPELYDMVNDPYQLQNVADDPAYAAVLSDLRSRLSSY